MDVPLWLSWLDQLARYYHSLPIFPLFSFVHFLLTASALRREPGSIQFAFRHPVASCVMTLVVASSGTLLANMLVGRPPLECVANGWNVLLGILSWYIIFFSPLDICSFLCAATPVQLLLFSVEEFGRAKKILHGVTLASSLYPNSTVAVAIAGMIMGTGKKWGMTLYYLVYKPESASNMELKSISFVTKVSFTIALVFAYNPAEEHFMLLVAALCLVVFRYRAILHKEDDFFTSVQQWLWWWATLLSIEYPDRGAGSVASSETHDQSECLSADAHTGGNAEENTLRKRTAKKLE